MTDLTGARASNKMKYFAVISIELKKYFEFPSNNLLEIQLDKFGFRKVALKLLISFLNDR